MDQISLELEPGLLDRFDSLEDVVVAMVYGGKKLQKSIAYDLDESPSSLTRKVKGDLDFPLKKLSALIESTGDMTPIYWLVEKHLRPKPAAKELAIRKALTCLEGHPDIQTILESLARATSGSDSLRAVK